MRLQKTKVILSGANRGIGWALAKCFAQNKTHLVLLNRTSLEDKKIELEKLGALSVEEHIVDLSQSASISDFLAQWQGKAFDILVHNSGQLTGGPFCDEAFSHIRSMFDVNLLGPIQLTQGLLPPLLKQKKGKIVFNASISAAMYLPFAGPYAASKAGLMAICRSLQSELKHTGVSTLLLLTPGVKTRMFDEINIKYGKNLDVSSLNSIGPDEFAQQVIEAIEKDWTEVTPGGFAYLGYLFARNFPNLFATLSALKMKNQKINENEGEGEGENVSEGEKNRKVKVGDK